MIVPQNRLLLWFAVIVLPFALLMAVEPAAGVVSLALIGALATALETFKKQAEDKGISVALPEISRMSKDREAKLELRIRNERQNQHTLRVALGFPREIPSPQEDAQVALPRDTEWSRFSWTCRPLKRGSYRIDRACLAASSPFGFWSVRKTVPVRSELRVYPNLFTERRHLAA